MNSSRSREEVPEYVTIILAAKTRSVEDLIEVIDAGATDIQRDGQIEVQSFDARGRKQRHRVEGLWARVMQHEIDHLNGILICDRKKLHRPV